MLFFSSYIILIADFLIDVKMEIMMSAFGVKDFCFVIFFPREFSVFLK